MALMVSDSEAFCNDEGELILADWQEVLRPDGTVHYQDRGHYFTRVFYPATPADFYADYCALWNNDELMIAEGIAHSTINDNDSYVGHRNRRNVWGHTVAGGLYDLTGFCEGDMVELNTVRRFQIVDDDAPGCFPDCDIREVVRKGPRLNCP